MGRVDPSHAEWRKSTLSHLNGCVEVAFVDGRVAVRDSKNRNGSILVFSTIEWTAFTDGVRDGQFELSKA